MCKSDFIELHEGVLVKEGHIFTELFRSKYYHRHEPGIASMWQVPEEILVYSRFIEQ